MPSGIHYNASNFTIPAFSPGKESGWSTSTGVTLAGVIIAALTLIVTLLKRPKVKSPSPQPDIEMGSPPPGSRDSAVTSVHSEVSIPERLEDTHREQANNMTYPIQMDVDEGRVMRNVLPPNEIGAAASRSTMIEISHHAGARQEGRPLRLLEPASFSTNNLLGIIDEELGRPPEASDDPLAIVRRATAP